MAVPGHNRQQVFLALGSDTRILRDDDHPIRCRRCTGSDQIALPFDLDHTNTATVAELFRRNIFYFKFTLKNSPKRRAVLSRRQIRVVTQTGNINTCPAGSLQNCRSGRRFHLLIVYDQIYGFHIQRYSALSFLFLISYVLFFGFQSSGSKVQRLNDLLLPAFAFLT